MVATLESDMLRFWARVDRRGDSECWTWTHRLNAGGYGDFPAQRRNWRAHRWLWERLNGPVPAGMQLDHLCRVRNCVNPAHLEVVSPRENTLRGTGPTAQNAFKTVCDNGHPYSDENTYSVSNRRFCLVCKRAADLAYWHRRSRARIESASAGEEVTNT